MHSKQEEFWSGDFGKNYSDRNPITADDANAYATKCYGLSRIEMNKMFLGDIPKEAKILEVGCNVGSQLRTLKEMGFKNLYGLELQDYAVKIARENDIDINYIKGSAFDLPFKDSYFDLVFTSGVLIHIHPDDLEKVMSEVYRVSNKYIWGFEYFSEDLKTINYRDNNDVLWKADYMKMYISKNPGLKEIKFHDFPYITETESCNVDRMFYFQSRSNMFIFKKIFKINKYIANTKKNIEHSNECSSNILIINSKFDYFYTFIHYIMALYLSEKGAKVSILSDDGYLSNYDNSFDKVVNSNKNYFLKRKLFFFMEKGFCFPLWN